MLPCAVQRKVQRCASDAGTAVVQQPHRFSSGRGAREEQRAALQGGRQVGIGLGPHGEVPDDGELVLTFLLAQQHNLQRRARKLRGHLVDVAGVGFAAEQDLDRPKGAVVACRVEGPPVIPAAVVDEGAALYDELLPCGSVTTPRGCGERCPIEGAGRFDFGAPENQCFNKLHWGIAGRPAVFIWLVWVELVLVA